MITEDRILVLTPSGHDGSNVSSILKVAKLHSRVCTSLKEMCELFEEGACMLLVAQEALTKRDTPILIDALAKQEPWSDIPLIVVTNGPGAALPDVDKVFSERINLSLIERPLSKATLISTIRSAVRARKRQYEVRELLRDLEVAREDAVVANRMKDDFLATVSHELRNPLNGILGFSQLLRRINRTPEELQKGLDVIERNARVQAALIDDLLDISRIVSGNLRLEIQLLAVAPVIRTAVESVKPAADSKQISITMDCVDTAASVLGDPSRIQQIVWNLLTNAIKFSRKGGKVEVAFKETDTEAVISVIDNGTGITKDFLPHVFDRFRQQDQAINRKKMGLGLGLSIVKHLVDMHSGTISAESDGEGKGATFTVRLPLAKDGVFISDTKSAAIDVPPYELLERSTSSIMGLKILAVDDEEDSRSLIKAVLEEYGAEVLTASCVGEAMVLLNEFSPNILLSDIGMPNEDGYTLIHKVRTSPNSRIRNIPAVALTAFNRAEDRMRSQRAGFQEHIGKPVSALELTELINGLTRQVVRSAERDSQLTSSV